MPIKHILKDFNPELVRGWNADFGIKNLVLDSCSYTPEVLILGTYNPNLSSNNAEIFYGRNYFWPALDNLSNNELRLETRRDAGSVSQPSLDRIFQLMRKFKLAFSDLLLEILPTEDFKLVIENGKQKIDWRGERYNPIDDADLTRLNHLDQCIWNTRNIIDYLNSHSNIKKVYFTRTSNGCWASQINEINNECPNITIKSIYTPSAQGGALHSQTGITGRGKMIPLLYHWLFIEAENNGCLDHEWLMNCDVDLKFWKKKLIKTY